MTRILLLTLCLPAQLVHAALSEDEIREAYHASYRYEKAQNYLDAIRTMAPVIDAYPKGYTANLRLGWLHYLRGAHASARAHYEAAIKVAPDSLEARLGLLLPLLAQERYAEAEAVARQVVRVDPANYYGNLRLAFALRLQDKPAVAEEILARQLAFYPTDIQLLTEWGLVKVAQDQPAERIFNDILTLDPENVVAKAQLARLTGTHTPTNPPPTKIEQP